MKKKKKNVIKENGNEIKWNIINSLLAGALVFFGSASTELVQHGFKDLEGLAIGICLGLATSVIVAISKFKDYWSGEKKEYSSKMFRFL